MTQITAFIVLALIAWGLQIGLSWLQIKRFNNAFALIKKGHYLGIGRNSNGRFRPRILIVLSFDENLKVIDAIMIKGLTVFASPKPFRQLHGMSLDEINPKKIFPNQPSCQSALEAALTLK